MTDTAMNNYPELAALASDWPDFLQPTLNSRALSGKQIVVTGAGDGIGKALAKTLACIGANVILLGRTRSKLEAVFDWINQHTDTDPVIVPCDWRAWTALLSQLWPSRYAATTAVCTDWYTMRLCLAPRYPSPTTLNSGRLLCRPM